MNLVLPKRIAILYSDAKRQYFATEKQYISEVEVFGRCKIIALYLEKMGIHTTLFPGDDNISDNLKSYKPDFVINLVDSVYGQEYLAATIPGTLELLRIPYTGSGIMGKTIDTNKFFTKNLLEQYGLTTPKFQLIKDPNDEIDPGLDFPLFAKLNEIHGSVEIDDSAVCEDEKQLTARIEFLMNTYHQPVLLEEFIMGREITAIVLEGMNTKVYAGEKIFKPETAGKYKIASFDIVWGEDAKYADAITYQKYELPSRVKEQVKTAFEILRMEDYAKFDFRLDSAGRHYFIDCNNNPALGPKSAFCAIGSILELYDVNFEDILVRLIRNTLSEKFNV